jgi:hypothetical protein
MAESVSQQDFYGQSQMHYMASSATDFVTGQTDEDGEHNEHLALQERMRHPIAFHAEMMGVTMYLNQALQQPDAAHFVEAVVQEVSVMSTTTTGGSPSAQKSHLMWKLSHLYGLYNARETSHPTRSRSIRQG